MKCSRCGKALTKDESYVYQNKVMCDDCMMDAGLTIRECDPWATYMDTAARKRHGQQGIVGLTDTEAKIYTFLKDKGKATRDEIKTGLGMSDADLNAQLVALMHSELVKEYSAAKQQYLATID